MSDPSTALSLPSPEHKALLEAMQSLLAPLGRLAVAQGLHFDSLEALLKLAMVQAAREAALKAKPEALPHRLVSRIATATGINRREVTRLVGESLEAPRPRPSMALRLFFRWSTDPALPQDEAGLPRQGPAPSFDALAALVTRDVHPRSLLDDMLRLKLVTWQQDSDRVSLNRAALVPDRDQARLLGLLGGNVGDHLSAAVDNVAGEQPRHFEQAIWANGLSLDSAQGVRGLVESHWQQLTQQLVPELQRRIDRDEADGAPTDAVVRVGMFMYSQRRPAPTAEPARDEEDFPDGAND
ncbi:DUF6502 family protein [Ideonella azotifigens]|uniref:Uncharacterized protein n=1 Tax=Ideonella azotifigens TaxID=513160 RepID=A0ABN1K2D7_9BURK|nr:DUF6502 family protein [Ideonella azotifigens]MCD2341804.1 DUF6502 family protein [Ideonella azotifigens]